MTTEINPAAMLPFAHPDYQPPSVPDVRALISRQGWTGRQAGAIAGVDSRTVRRWTGGGGLMSYSSWRLLLINAGLAER